MRASHGLSKLTAQHVATAFDLSPFTSACHLGGTSLCLTGVRGKRLRALLLLLEAAGALPADRLTQWLRWERIRLQGRTPKFNP